MEIKYAYWEDLAVRLTSDGDAWMFNELTEKWAPMNAADAVTKAKLLTEAEFDKMFPDLPALPTEAFKV
jgi:hypothetical protein